MFLGCNWRTRALGAHEGDLQPVGAGAGVWDRRELVAASGIPAALELVADDDAASLGDLDRCGVPPEPLVAQRSRGRRCTVDADGNQVPRCVDAEVRPVRALGEPVGVAAG